jgi:UDP-GlcNAc:undecaprenyl-phosphate/decaprenyl-phosphate GlcNAc-1-phosphate transferase
MTNFILISVIINFTFCLFFDKISTLINIFDNPDDTRKFHKKNVAAIGGFLYFINLIFFLSYLVIFDDFLDDYKLKFLNGLKQYFSFFLISSLIFIVGVLDDKIDLSALKKLIIFIFLIIFSLIDQNIQINFLSFEFLNFKIFLNEMGIFFSMISIFYFMNALNMYDGINIQTPLYLFLLFAFLIFKEQSIVIFLILPSIFFLFLNLKGKCFLGNSGSYLLGYLISIILIKINQANPSLLTSEEILILLSIPCIELFRLFIERIVKNKNPFNADTNHIHHLLSKDFNNLITSLITNGFIFIPLVIAQFTDYKMTIFILQFCLYFLLIIKLKKNK